MSEEQKPAESRTAVVRMPELQFRPLAGLRPTEIDPNQFQTNFAGRGPEAARFITQALAKEGLRLDECGSTVFMTKYYLAHVAEFVDVDGEVIPMPRVVLIGPAGEVLQFVSEGAIKSLDVIRSLCGDGPWAPPLPISVVKVRTRRGFFTYRLALGELTNGEQASAVPSERSESSAQGSDPKVQKAKRG